MAGSSLVCAEPALVVVGSARLPQSLAHQQPTALLLELGLDAQGECIVDVTTSISLPGCNALLRQLLVGKRLEELGGAIEQLRARLRGPLLKPTIAALVNAIANGKPEA